MPQQDLDVVKLAFMDFDTELANTRKVLERVKTEHLGFKPHEKSQPLGQMAQHIANLPWWFEISVTQDEYDMATWVRPEPAKTAEEILAAFDKNAAIAKGLLADLKAESLMDTWTLRAGDTIYFQMPRISTLRTFAISHIIHHRAQLTMYLRLLNVPIPGLYGPSADEQ